MKPSQPKNPNPCSKGIADLAIEWVLEQQEGFSAGRASQFQAWCQADPRHAEAVAKAERALDLLEELPALQDELAVRFQAESAAREAPTSLGSAVTPSRRTWLWGRWAATAAAIAIIGGAALWWRGSVLRPSEIGYMSNVDRPQQVILNDGSFVDLNTNTTIRTQMLPHERRIALQEGEAHFAVAHDTSRPFIVEAAGVLVRAVGTAFNVRITNERVEVLVLEGKVEISEARPGQSVSAASRPQLTIADRAVISRGSDSPSLLVERVGENVLQDAVAWHSLVTTISSRPLREIVALFNQRNELHLVIADNELAERTLGGFFALDQPLTFIRALEIDGDVESETRGENEIVLRRKR